MLAKTIAHKLMGRIKHGAVKLHYWDGSAQIYGKGKPGVTISVHKPSVVWAGLLKGSIGIGEAYTNGSLEVHGSIDDLLRLLNRNQELHTTRDLSYLLRPSQRNVRSSQRRQVQHHYDLGNDFYRLWLDDSLTYSCAYFHNPADPLEQAQLQKVDHLLKKLQISPGMSVLDIGSGWGTLLLRAAQQYGATGLGITLSKEQHKYSNKRAKELGVSGQVRFELTNYQDLRNMQFDRVISVGMFEHVGRRNHEGYFAAVQRLLAPKGISVLHTITHEKEEKTNPWIDKYIFPGGYIPSIRETIGHLPNYGFRLVDYENLRIHYAMTLDEWLRRFEANVSKVQNMYDERFVRMWRFYLATSASAFRYSGTSLSQFVFTNGLVNDLPLTRDFLYEPNNALKTIKNTTTKTTRKPKEPVSLKTN